MHALQLMRNSRHVSATHMASSRMRHCQSQLRRIQSSTDVRTWAEQLRAHELRTGAAGAGTPVERTDSGRTATSEDGDGHHMRPLSMSHGPARWVVTPGPPVVCFPNGVCCRCCCCLLHHRQNTCMCKLSGHLLWCPTWCKCRANVAQPCVKSRQIS